MTHGCDVRTCLEPVRTTFTNGQEKLDLCEHHEHMVGDHWREQMRELRSRVDDALDYIDGTRDPSSETVYGILTRVR